MVIIQAEKVCGSCTKKKYEISMKMVSTAQAIPYAGESSELPDLKLQQWGNTKDDVGNA